MEFTYDYYDQPGMVIDWTTLGMINVIEDFLMDGEVIDDGEG